MPLFVELAHFDFAWLLKGRSGRQNGQIGFNTSRDNTILSTSLGIQLKPFELELELIQSHMAQKPMLRGEVGARALRVRSDVTQHVDC